MMRRFSILLIAFLCFAQGALAVGVDEKQLDDPALEAYARSIMAEVRCLVCQNQSIIDSNAEIAADLRAVIRERVAAGETAEDIKDFLVMRYGEWVLLRPPFRAGTAFLWVSPFLVLLPILLLVFLRRSKTALPSALSNEEEAILRELMAAEKSHPQSDVEQPAPEQADPEQADPEQADPGKQEQGS